MNFDFDLIFRNPASYFYLYRISYMWYAPLGFLIAIVLGLIVSLVTRGNERELDPKLFFPFVAKKIQENRNFKANSTYTFNRNSKKHRNQNDSML